VYRITQVEAAEEAFLKMNNVLIDDRRIKVDFSQSVSKLWNRFNRGAKDMDSGSFDAEGNERGGGKGGQRWEGAHTACAYTAR
jgi:peptidyl-prolyl cis-trans isomerase-like 4